MSYFSSAIIILEDFYYYAFYWYADSKTQSSTDKCVFATVNQVFGGSSQLPTTAEHCFIVWSVLNDLITARSAVVERREEPPSIWLTVAKTAFVGWAFKLKVCMLVKDAVN